MSRERTIKAPKKIVICLCKILKDKSLDEVEFWKVGLGGEHTLTSTIAQHCRQISVQ